MADKSGFSSIADAIAAAEKAKSARRAPLPKAPWFQGGGATAPKPAAKPTTKPAATSLDDIKDDFDYAIEAVETARAKLPRDAKAAETMATTFLMARRQIARAEAADLVKRAVHYLGR